MKKRPEVTPRSPRFAPSVFASAPAPGRRAWSRELRARRHKPVPGIRGLQAKWTWQASNCNTGAAAAAGLGGCGGASGRARDPTLGRQRREHGAGRRALRFSRCWWPTRWVAGAEAAEVSQVGWPELEEAGRQQRVCPARNRWNYESPAEDAG